MAVSGLLSPTRAGLGKQNYLNKPGLWNELVSVDQKSNKHFMKTVKRTAETHVQK